MTHHSFARVALVALLVPFLGHAAERSDADKARDAGRKPAEVLAFLGVEPGMTVLDLIAAGGWYTEVLADAVGPEGKVYAQNTERALQVRDGANARALAARLEGNRLPNVVRLDREMGDLGLEPGSIDLALTALNFHDIYNSAGEEVAVGFLRAVHGVLEPGGILGLIDHDGRPDQDNAKLHRIPKTDAIAAAQAAGFEVVAEGTMLENPKDDHTQNVFAEGLRGHTDRFVLKLRKPLPATPPVSGGS